MLKYNKVSFCTAIYRESIVSGLTIIAMPVKRPRRIEWKSEIPHEFPSKVIKLQENKAE